MADRWLRTGVRGEDYDARFAALEQAGKEMHGEADLVASLGVSSILDAGCGTGRVAIELARRGLRAVGIDRSTTMLQAARNKAPQIDWFEADLTHFTVPSPDDPAQPDLFEGIVMAGNVMIFVDSGTEEAVLANMTRHLTPGGMLVSGFQLQADRLSLHDYDAFAASAGLRFSERWATWDRAVWTTSSDYAVTVHCKPV